jgi:hypothetical protein
LFCALAIYSVVNIRSRFFILAAPWLSIGAYSILFSLLNSYGRSGNGLAQALKSRYTTPNLLISVALLQLCLLMVIFLGKAASKRLILSGLAIFLAITANTYVSSFAEANYGEHGAFFKKREAICMALINYIDQAGMPHCFEVDENASKENIFRLNRIGIKHPLKDIAFSHLSPQTEQREARQFNSPTLTASGDNVTVSGKLLLPTDQSSSQWPAAVLLAVDNQKSFVAVANLNPQQTNRAGELAWQVEMRAEQFASLAANAQNFNVYLYYPAQKQFVYLNSDIPLAS